MVAKKARQSRAAPSKSVSPGSTSDGGKPSKVGRPDTAATKKPRGTVPPSKEALPTKGKSTKSGSTSSSAPSKATLEASTGSKGTKAPARASRAAPKAPATSDEELFGDVPVEPVRRKRRTVPTSTGRRRIKTHRPAPHASAPPATSGDEARETTHEDSELAQLPTQEARGEGSRGGGTLPIEIDPERIEQSLKKIAGELSTWARRGRYTKVRFRFRGKPLLPDLPLAAVVAAEGLTFYWGGILRALLMNVAGGSLLDVELIHDAEKEIQAGKEALLSGELDRALGHYRRAVEMQPDGAQAHLNLGIALKLQGNPDGASAALRRALELDPEGPIGMEAKRLLERL